MYGDIVDFCGNGGEGGGGQDEVRVGVCWGIGVANVLWEMVVDGSS